MSIQAFLDATGSTAAVNRQNALLAGIGALAAIGRTDELSSLLDHYLGAGLDPGAVYETVLQLYLFAGYPRAINALAALHDARERAGLPPLPPVQDPPPPGELARWHESGIRLCQVIYGKNFDRLQARMRALSPDLACWMIVEGYGKVLSRPALDAAARERSVIGALTALETWRQLNSHLRGSLNLGIGAAELAETLDLLAHLLPGDAVRHGKELLNRIVSG